MSTCNGHLLAFIWSPPCLAIFYQGDECFTLKQIVSSGSHSAWMITRDKTLRRVAHLAENVNKSLTIVSLCRSAASAREWRRDVRTGEDCRCRDCARAIDEENWQNGLIMWNFSRDVAGNWPRFNLRSCCTAWWVTISALMWNLVSIEMTLSAAVRDQRRLTAQSCRYKSKGRMMEQS